MATTTISVPMDDELRERIAALAAKEERDLAPQIRYMCKKFFEEGVIHPTLVTPALKSKGTGARTSHRVLEALARFDAAPVGSEKKRALEELPAVFPASLQERARSIVVGEGRAAERRNKLEALITEHGGQTTPTGLCAANPKRHTTTPEAASKQ